MAVGARDVLHMVELAAGAGMARDAIRIAHDPHAPLARKAQLFVAASETAKRTSQQDLERLGYLLEVLATTTDIHASREVVGNSAEAGVDYDVLPSPPSPSSPSSPTSHPHVPQPHAHAVLAPQGSHHLGHHGHRGRPRGHPHPTGEDQSPPRRTRQRRQPDELTPSQTYLRERQAKDTEDSEAEHDVGRDLAPALAVFPQPRLNVRTPGSLEGGAGLVVAADDKEEERFLRADTGMSQALRVDLSERRETAARHILSNEPLISVRTFARRVEEATRKGISESTAQALMARVRAALVYEAEAAEQAGRPLQLPPMPDVRAD